MPQCIRKNKQRSVSEIQQLTDRYHDYVMSGITSPEKVYLSNVFEKEDLRRLLADDCDGVRVMLVKEDDIYATDGKAALIGQARVGLIAIQVKKVPVYTGGGKDDSNDFRFENMLSDTNSVIYEECPSKYCDSSVTSRILP